MFNGDTAADDFRLCRHTGRGQMEGGWRVGSFSSLNSSSDFEKLIFVAGNVSVSAPAALALFGLGVLSLGLRRR